MQIANNHQDLLLLIMYWIHGSDEQEIFKEENHRRSLGFVTALAWFANNENYCIKKLAKELREQKREISDFLNRDRFDSLLVKDEQNRTSMVNLLSPEAVKDILRYPIWNSDGDIKDDAWTRNGFWELYPIDEHSDCRSTQ